MRVPVVLVLAIVSEARKYEDDDAVAKGIDVYEHHIKPSGPMPGAQRLGYPKTGPQRPITFSEKAKAPFDEASIGSYHQFEPIMYEKPSMFSSARDEILFLIKHPEFNGEGNQKGDTATELSRKPNNTKHLLVKPIAKADEEIDTTKMPVSEEDSPKFTWMTCDEFSEKAHFNPKAQNILNKPWAPFFVWSQGHFPLARLHTFTIPSKQVVKRYKDKFSKYMKKTIDWNAPMLLMTVTREHLLIAVDQKGSFISVPRKMRPSVEGKRAVFKTIDIRLKMVGSYLAMMFCINSPYYATIMALPRHLPATVKAKNREAAKLRFRGRGYAVSRGNVTLHKGAMREKKNKGI